MLLMDSLSCSQQVSDIDHLDNRVSVWRGEVKMDCSLKCLKRRRREEAGNDQQNTRVLMKDPTGHGDHLT